MEEFQGTEQIFMSRQNQNINERVDRSDLEYSTGKQYNCIEAWTGNGHERDVMVILSTGFGKSMIFFTVFALVKEEVTSSKTFKRE